MKAAFYTLGCKVNQNETGALQELFRKAGYEIVPMEANADIYIVNSCTVTAGGDAKSRQWLRRARRQNPQAVTVLTGCFPQAFPDKAAIPEADVVTGTRDRAGLPARVQEFLDSRRQVVKVLPHETGEAFENLPAEGRRDRTRAFVKVEDGCNRRCAYCIIPIARGPVRSRETSSITDELAAHAANGYREVVFTGINLPSYGRDTGTDLAALVETAAGIKGIDRIRLSSLDPDLVTPEQIQRFAAVAKLCPQFHLSLQSGCDTTLNRMRRPYTAAQYREAARTLREAIPGATLTTDVIVGFPGETEDDFLESLSFVRELRFLKVHVFPFSPRPGTPAASFTGQVPNAEKSTRARRMQAAADAIRGEVIAEQVGHTASVLLEKLLENGMFTGYTEQYLPVLLEAEGHGTGEIVPVHIDSFDGAHCRGHTLK